MQKAVLGQLPWQGAVDIVAGASGAKASGSASPKDRPEASASIPCLQVPRGKAPLSLYDWKIWAQARPTLWRYGDACNLFPERQTPLLPVEWMISLLLREEMEYTLPTDKEPFRVRDKDTEAEVNRFAADWITLHLMATMHICISSRKGNNRPSHF